MNSLTIKLCINEKRIPVHVQHGFWKGCQQIFKPQGTSLCEKRELFQCSHTLKPLLIIPAKICRYLWYIYWYYDLYLYCSKYTVCSMTYIHYNLHTLCGGMTYLYCGLGSSCHTNYRYTTEKQRKCYQNKISEKERNSLVFWVIN